MTLFTQRMINYKSILLVMNAHRRSHNANNSILDNICKNIIALLISGKIQVETSIPHARNLNNQAHKRVGEGVISRTMILINNKVDYVHWDDPNELVDRLRLLEASHQEGHNIHDNEICLLSRNFVKLALL